LEEKKKKGMGPPGFEPGLLAFQLERPIWRVDPKPE